jgi:hypothetical protein
VAAPIKLMRSLYPSGFGGSAGGAGSGSTQVRTTATITTAAIANNITENDNLVMARTFTLLSIEVSAYARVRLYSTDAARTADASRPLGAPTPAGTQNGIIAEVIMVSQLGVLSWMMSPAAQGFNDDSPAATTIYAAVTNLSGANSTITVTFTYLPLE